MCSGRLMPFSGFLKACVAMSTAKLLAAVCPGSTLPSDSLLLSLAAGLMSLVAVGTAVAATVEDKRPKDRHYNAGQTDHQQCQNDCRH